MKTSIVAFGSMVTLLLLSGGLQVHAIDNGIGLLPPMGWRSWNCFGNDINQTRMEAVMDAMTARERSISWEITSRTGMEAARSRNVSLLDLGYINVGLDDAWQACGEGLYGGFHDEAGNPIIDTTKFPDMASMNDKAHGYVMRALA